MEYPRKKRDFINPSEFSQKTPLQNDQKNRWKNTGKTQKNRCSWWPLGRGMHSHCENIIKNGLFWPFFHFKLLAKQRKVPKKNAKIRHLHYGGVNFFEKTDMPDHITPNSLISFFTKNEDSHWISGKKDICKKKNVIPS